MKKKLTKFFDRIKLTHNKDYAAAFRQQPYQKYLYDYTVKNITEQIGYIRKEFHNAAFIGYNPETFVQLLPPSRYPLVCPLFNFTKMFVWKILFFVIIQQRILRSL